MPDQGRDESRSIWKRPLRGPKGTLMALTLLGGTVFLIVAGLAVVTWDNVQPIQLVVTSLLVALGVAAVVGALIFAFRWIRRPGNLRLTFFLLACLLTLILLFYAVENWRGKRAWDKYRREWEAKGEQFSFAALVPAPVPDDKNLAMAPLLSPALNLVRQPQVTWLDTNGLARLYALSAGHRMRYETNDVEMGNLALGTLADLQRSAQFYRGNTNYPQASPNANPAETILTALSRFQKDLDELHQAAAARPQARFPIDYAFEPYSGILLPHLALVKNLAQVVQVRATAELEAHRPDEALADLKLSFRLADSLREEPILIDHLVRLSMLLMSLQTVREGLVRHSWTDAQLGELQVYLASLDLLSEYKHCMRGERAAMAGEINFLRRHRALTQNYGYRASAEPDTATPSMPVRWIPGGWFFQNMITLSKMHQDFFLPAVDERTRRVDPRISQNGARAFDQLRAGPYTLLAKLLFPALDKAPQRSAQAQVWVDAARVACALERYRLAHGALPDNLAAIPPALLKEVPTDVFDGKPLRYRRDAEGGYMLYSIGWNQTDEGGKMATSKKNAAAQEFPVLTEGDWVWQMPGR